MGPTPDAHGGSPGPQAAATTATPAAPPPVASAAPAAPANAPIAAQKFGEPVTASVVSLTDIAKSPAAFKGKPIATTGKVTAVCQERGCWMAIKDTTHDAMVRMHGHSFFVPRTSAGKDARVQGTVMLVKDGKECDDMAAQGAELELDATGVELM